MRKRTLRITAAVGFLALLAPASAIDVDNPPAGVFQDEWYAVYLQGRKSGHMHATTERIKRPEGDVIRSESTMRIEIGRGSATIAIALRQWAEETLDGKPLAFFIREQLGMVPKTTRGKISDGKVVITTRQFGIPREAAYDLPPNAMFDWAAYRAQVKRGFKPGDRYDLPLYIPTVQPDKLTPATIEMLEPETIDLFGRKVQAVKARKTTLIQGAQKLEEFIWFGPDATPLRVHSTLAQIKLELSACTKSVALAENEPTELMESTLIPASQPIPGDKARSITFRIQRRPGTAQEKLPDIPETGLQTVISRSDAEVVVKVTRRSARGQAPAPIPLTPEEQKLYLAPTSLLNHQDPQVAELIKRASGDEKDPRRLAERFCGFVADYLDRKSLNVGFATASEVARSREGDCTEHGILLAALGRGAGIPTRIVTGVVYSAEFGRQRHVFVGHLWTQYWLDGQWIDLDAAFNQVDVDPTHIAFGISAAGDSALADIFTSFFQVMGGLQIVSDSIE